MNIRNYYTNIRIIKMIYGILVLVKFLLNKKNLYQSWLANSIDITIFFRVSI